MIRFVRPKPEVSLLCLDLSRELDYPRIGKVAREWLFRRHCCLTLELLIEFDVGLKWS